MNWDLFDRWNGWLLPRLADHLWQSTLIGLTALLVVYLLHRQSARLRHVLLLLGMAKFLVPSALLVASLDLLGITLAGLSPSTSATTVSYLHPSLWLPLREQVPVARMTASVDKWSGVYLALVSTWLLGCLFLTMVWVRRRWLVEAAHPGFPWVARQTRCAVFLAGCSSKDLWNWQCPLDSWSRESGVYGFQCCCSRRE